MNAAIWLLVGTGILTGVFLMLVLPIYIDIYQVVIPAIITAFAFLVTSVIGYATVYLAEYLTLYNMHTVILLPWVPTFFLILLFFDQPKLFPFDPGTQLILAFSSVGGVMAHKKRLKKKFDNLITH